MITRNRTKTVLTLAVILGVLAAFSGSLQAVLVYEPFDYPAGKVDGLAVNAVGLTGTWSANYTDDTCKIKGGSLTYSTLPTAGNHWGPGGVWTDPWIEATLDPAVMTGHLDDGDELWFSYVGNPYLQGVTNMNQHRLQIGADAANNVAIYASKIDENTGGQVRASITIDGSETVSTESVIFTDQPRLFVGRVIFGETDTVEVYLPGPDLVKPETPAGTVTGSLDQSTFDMLRSQVTNGNSGVDADEIRIGTTYDDVVGIVPTKAHDPNPADGAGDVARTSTLTWTPSEFAAPTNGHKVYFGESFNDVNDGIGGITQSTTSYDPGRLNFETLYYWRVDEVNAPPDSTVYPGEVWSFTTELLAYPIENVTATASSSNVDEGAENTVNDSGVDANDLHSTETTDMWLSSPDGVGPAWIEYEFDRVSKLNEMWVWNHNSSLEQIYGFGFRDVSVEYSVDGIVYKALGTTHEFAQAPGTPDYAHETTIDFDGAAAKYVRLTANSTWGSVLSGLSEVRFFGIPVHATEPYPDSGATDVDLDVILGWKAGREAVTHNVYVSADPDALILAGPVTEPAFDTASLDLALGQTYHWRVDEVNDAETTTTWQGDIWNFTTVELLVVEDFESYNDIDPPDPESHTIFGSWSDGYLTPTTNGALVGYEPAQPPSQPSYMEHTIVYDGDQSMPFSYNNTIASYSEASVNTDDLAIGRDWTKGSPTTMLLRFYGDPNNALTEQLYVKIGDTRFDYPGDVAALAEPRWSEWPIDLTGMDLSNVTELAIGFDRLGGVGGQGTVMIDAVWLNAASTMVPVTVPDAGFDDHVLNNVGDSIYVGDSGYTGA